MSSTPLLALIARCRALSRPRSEAIRTAGKYKLAVALLLLALGAAGTIGHALEPNKPQSPQVRTDRHGDPLPDGAIARLGTVRWRHGFFVHALAYSPDGTRIAAVGGGRAITLWNVADGKEIHRFPNSNQPNAVVFSPDGKLLATTDTPICRLWDVATGKEVRQLKGHTNGLRSVAFAPDGKTLATSSYDGTARIWETSSGKELRCLDCKQGNLYSAAYAPDGKLLATGGKDGSIRLWDTATGSEVRQLKGHKKGIWDLVFSPDGKYLASSSDNPTVRLWNPTTGKQIRLLNEKTGGTRLPLAFSPDGTLLAFGRWDGTIRLWDMGSGEEKRRWQAGIEGVRAVAFAPDGKTLASGGRDGCIRLWDVATGREKNPSDAHRGVVDLVRFLPEGKELISIGRDQRLLSWNLAAKTPRQVFSWPVKNSRSFAFSLSGDNLAVDDCPDSRLRLWNVRTGKPGLALVPRPN